MRLDVVNKSLIRQKWASRCTELTCHTKIKDTYCVQEGCLETGALCDKAAGQIIWSLYSRGILTQWDSRLRYYSSQPQHPSLWACLFIPWPPMQTNLHYTHFVGPGGRTASRTRWRSCIALSSTQIITFQKKTTVDYILKWNQLYHNSITAAVCDQAAYQIVGS